MAEAYQAYSFGSFFIEGKLKTSKIEEEFDFSSLNKRNIKYKGKKLSIFDRVEGTTYKILCFLNGEIYKIIEVNLQKDFDYKYGFTEIPLEFSIDKFDISLMRIICIELGIQYFELTGSTGLIDTLSEYGFTYENDFKKYRSILKDFELYAKFYDLNGKSVINYIEKVIYKKFHKRIMKKMKMKEDEFNLFLKIVKFYGLELEMN